MNKDVLEWLECAKMDFITAKHLYKTLYPIPHSIVCYHCQQSAEKYLKALILANNGKIKKTHDLLNLLEYLSTCLAISDSLKLACANLTRFATRTRYPTDENIDETLTKKALQDMDTVVNWVKKELKVE